MPTVDFVTFCHPPHLEKLHSPSVLKEMVESHRWDFGRVYVVHQRCVGHSYRPITDIPHTIVASEDYHPGILGKYGIPEYDDYAERMTHGPNAAHYWKWHVINHLIGLEVSQAQYIVFSDCDCLIKSMDKYVSWIETGMHLLQSDRQVLIVSPGDGGENPQAKIRLRQNVSQQLFICEHERFCSEVDLGLPFNGIYNAPGGPMQEYYFMLEGRIGRYMTENDLYRAILPDEWVRYWHYNPWEPKGWLNEQT